MPLKRSRFGFKPYLCVDKESGFILNTYLPRQNLSAESERKGPGGFAGFVVRKLVAQINEPSNRLITMDQGFSSPLLFKELRIMGFHALGTTKLNRIGSPSNIPALVERGEHATFESGGFFFTAYKDRKNVIFLSTFRPFESKKAIRCGRNRTLLSAPSTNVL